MKLSPYLLVEFSIIAMKVSSLHCYPRWDLQVKIMGFQKVFSMNNSRIHLSCNLCIILYRLHHGMFEKRPFAMLRGTNLTEQLTFVSGEKLLLRVFSEVPAVGSDGTNGTIFNGGIGGRCSKHNTRI